MGGYSHRNGLKSNNNTLTCIEFSVLVVQSHTDISSTFCKGFADPGDPDTQKSFNSNCSIKLNIKNKLKGKVTKLEGQEMIIYLKQSINKRAGI